MNLKHLFTYSAAAALIAGGALAMDTHPTTGEALADNQTFTYRLLDQFPTLDPQLIEETAGNHVGRQLFEALIIQDENGGLVPGVASEWSSPDGNNTWEFKLRPEAKWSNGDPVTAHDFVYAWRRAADPATASPYGWYVELSSITNAAQILAGEASPDTLGVEAVDDHTLRVTLETPLPYFPNIVTYSTFYPAHQATIEAHGSDWTKPENIVGNGAYTLEELVLNEFFTLKKNPNYWNADATIIEEVKGVIINDVNTALTRYKAGEIDMLEPLPPGQYPSLKEEMPEQAHSVPRLCSYYYAVNFTDSGNPALQDVNVRKALSYAIDRDVIVNQVLKGGQAPSYNFTHWATAGFEKPTIDYSTWTQAERDAKAKELMSAAGYGAGGEPLELQLIYNTSESHKAIATVMAQMWKQKLGVEVSMENMEWQTYLEVRGEQKFDVARSAWCGDYNEASTFLDLVTTTHGANDGKYSNGKVDELMKASKTSMDPQAAYTEVEQILADEMAIIPIYHYANTFLLDETLKGFPMNNVENNWYVKNFYRVAE
ncbi:peptide ABC transporter substrate-binding protein [Ovoidimarina sediminis]|uniref:peptide ABC transporter substrate-binding protein n=1 Tax=Ovoidimarina sediminis TaxID=3079856 RepID=UPI00291254AA|nr:peptide ABC transporter substrate-binding protein [Rhodophyticola sp. MJ-SS7]MDU8942038.1 peptide ABC transporter substrate-binding protein [Rhodophyticola sp. MJ-SS7]